MTKCFLKAKIRKMEAEIMNGRQAAKKAAEKIEELEAVVALQAQDIKDYNACMQDVIAGNSPCEWCEEQPECQLQAKGGKGCPEWWLRYRKAGDPVEPEAEVPVQRVEKQG